MSPLNNEVTSAPVPPATASLMASVAARQRTTICTATTPSNKASGSWTKKVRTSCPGSLRSTAWRVDNSNKGRTTTPASAVIAP